ncbi:PAS domain S-box protein [Microcoleus sp. LEGE 07076]|uniref:PAS domain S-box protein n=1 Tax=Microcoleus sp. LEGE 07076 TaxID=915322 RepID=UPI00187F293A|nr:PAS domain S-box protein [Microcoleus sp. LEGE 07076]MBE9183710.1 PAS domain S-box protein [Microcoleus sp. LEGE 07076]
MKAVFNLAIPPTCFNILLVEDNHQEAELIEDLLSGISGRQRILVTKVERLSEAQQRLSQETFDIILLDLSLPDSLGVETVDRVKEYGVNVPIVVLTAQNDEELALRLISAGVQDYLVKRKIDGELLIRSLRYAIERQNSQDALRKSEEKYRSVVENSLIGIAIVAPIVHPAIGENCNWIEVNDALCDLLGYERDELVQKHWLELIHPEDFDVNEQQLSQMLAGTNDGYICDKRWLRKDGEIVHTRVSLRCIRGRDGSIDRMIEVVLDVSDRYRYEAQLKASEDFLNHTINATPDPIFVKDEQHRWIILNDAVCQFVGKSRQELLGKSDYDFFPKSEADVFWAKDEEVLTTGICLENEETLTDTAGKERIISTKKSVFQKADGSKVIVGTIRDFTEYRRQQRALEQSEARFQKLVANLPGSIYQFRRSATGQRCFPYVSSGCRQLYELEAEVIEQNAEIIFNGIHPDDRLNLETSIEVSAATLEPWQHQWRQILPSGKVKWLQGASRPERLNNQIESGSEGDILWDGLVMDITELKQAQTERDRFFTISLDLLCIVGYDGCFKRLNPAWSTVLGYSTAELFAKRAIEFVHPDDREATAAEAAKLIAGTSSISFENRYLCKDGSYKCLLWTASPFGEEGLIYSVGHDITSRKQAESKLQQQAVAMGAAYDGIAIFNDRKECIYSNDAYLKMYGLASTSELFGKKWKMLYSYAENQYFEREVMPAIQEKGYCNIEALGQRDDGTKFPQELSLTMLAGGEIISIVRDITKRKQAESALRASQRRYQTLAEASPVCIFHSDAFGNCFYVNQRWSEITGLKAELAAETGWMNAIHPDDAERVKNEWYRAVIHKIPFKSEYRFQHPDGRVVWAIGQAIAEIGDGQEIKGYIGTITDISDRKQAELNLLRVTQAVESTSDAIGIADLTGRSIYHNQAFIQRYGYTAEELNTAGGATAIYPKTQVLLEMLKTLRKGKSWQGELKIKTKSNELVTTLFRADCIKDETGNLIALVGVMTDITERKQAEMALLHQLRRERLVVAMLDRIRSSLNLEEVLTAAVEQVRQFLQTDRTVIYRFNPDWSGFVVVESVANNRISLLNLHNLDTCFTDGFVDIYQQGYIRSIEDIYSENLSECHIKNLEELEVKANLIVPILKARETISASQPTAGNLLWGLLIAQDCSGPRAWDSSEIESLRQLCVQLAIAIQQSTLFQQAQTEIADRKVAEAALQQAVLAAETANRAKSEFLANMSHELRTPLNGVLGYAQILKTDKDLTSDHQDSLSNIQQCGEHLLMLIDDVLDLSKIEARKMELYPEELNFLDFIKNIADLFEMRASQKGISFNYEQVSPLPNCVKVDRKRLRQILINLLSNAVKFTKSGKVTFKVGYVGTGAWSRGQGENYNFSILTSELKQNYMRFAHNAIAAKHDLKIRFQIEDTGRGIDQSKLEEIFLPFHQVGGNTFVEGTGLGLSISQKLAKLMGSEIRVNSTLGKGSTFWLDLELPAAKRYLEVSPLREKRWLVGFVGHKRKVLIVDDNQLNRGLLCRLLGRLGFEIAEASNGQECLYKAVEFKPDVILMDLRMPVMDGLETARRLRQLPEFKDIVLIALSASVFESAQQESLLAGCNDFVAKPIEANHFLERLRVHLGLEWIYEESPESNKRKTPSLSPASDFPACSALLPAASESVAKLLKLAAMGDIEDFFKEIAKLETLEPKLVPFATKLRPLAKGFQLKQIRSILKQYIDG